MAFDTSQPFSNDVAKLINVGRGNAGGQPPPSGDETLFFELTFTDGLPDYMGAANAHPGGGDINFYGNSGAVGINGSNIYYDTINDDPLFPGTVEVLRDTYFSNPAVYSFENQTLFGSHPPSRTVYKRLRIKFSSNFQFGNDQLKFCKNKGEEELSTNCPKFRGTDGRMYITKLDTNGNNEQSLYPTAPSTFGEEAGLWHLEDDIINDFGGVGVDGIFTPVNNQWYWFEWYIDCGTPGGSDGSYRIWIDGKLYLSKDNAPIRRATDGPFTGFELGHVWQDSASAPAEDISMYWHSLAVYDKRPANLPIGIAA